MGDGLGARGAGSRGTADGGMERAAAGDDGGATDLDAVDALQRAIGAGEEGAEAANAGALSDLDLVAPVDPAVASEVAGEGAGAEPVAGSSNLSSGANIRVVQRQPRPAKQLTPTRGAVGSEASGARAEKSGARRARAFSSVRTT